MATDEISKTEWRPNFGLPKDYSAHSEKFIGSLLQLQSMSDVQLRYVNAVYHWIELNSMNNRPIPTVPYRALPKSVEFKTQEIQ